MKNVEKKITLAFQKTPPSLILYNIKYGQMASYLTHPSTHPSYRLQFDLESSRRILTYISTNTVDISV